MGDLSVAMTTGLFALGGVAITQLANEIAARRRRREQVEERLASQALQKRHTAYELLSLQLRAIEKY
jgi:hypothetical protein